MILNLLQQEGLSGRVDGEYLQGGIGELPAAGLVKVMVPEQDYAAAKLIVDKWDAAQPDREPIPVPKKAGNKFGIFAVGLMLGILCTYAYYRTPVTVDGTDHNRDGVLDDKWTYAPTGLIMKNEVDRNLDGKIDYVSKFDRNGTIESAESDDNFDGVFESQTIYRLGNPQLIETDTDGDGYRDFKMNFVNGVLVADEYIYPTTGLPQKIDYFKLGKLTHSETDTDKDGKMDKRTNYNGLGEVASVENIR
jgi:hypothetical protein